MDLINIIRSAQGGRAIENMARTFNLTPAQAEAAIQAVLPELAHGISRNTLSRGGVADLVEALGDPRHTTRLESPNIFGNPEIASEGNAILGHILGTKDASRGAAQRASLSSGLGEGLIKMLLPYIAQLLMGALASKTQGGLGDILSKIPGMPGSTTPVPEPTPRSGRRQRQPEAEDAPAFPTEAPVGRGGGGFENQQPLPIPGSIPDESETRGRNPYGDLSDVIRGGRPSATQPTGGTSLPNIIRDMLGGALGYSTKGGVMGWIFRAVILRYGWSILRSILGGVLGRR